MARATRKMNFKVMARQDVPQGRNGKHHHIVNRILSDLEHVGTNRALKVPLSELNGGKEKVRSALNRATHKLGMSVATASDNAFLYIWSEPGVDQ